LFKNTGKMTATLAQPKTLTFKEFLEMEAQSAVKHEFHKGKIKEMPGGTQRHSVLAQNVGFYLKLCTKRKSQVFHVFQSDMAIYMEPIDKSVYADVSVVEGLPWGYDGEKTSILNPKLIVEVLSPSTQDYDKGDKFDNYRLLPDFREYILVHTSEPKVDCYYLKDPTKNVWLYHQIKGLDAVLKFQSIGCSVKLKDLYADLPPNEA
jgi:Uma2 family endonuclease